MSDFQLPSTRSCAYTDSKSTTKLRILGLYHYYALDDYNLSKILKMFLCALDACQIGRRFSIVRRTGEPEMVRRKGYCSSSLISPRADFLSVKVQKKMVS